MAGINGAPRRISAENPGHGDELLGKRLSPHPAPEEWPRIPVREQAGTGYESPNFPRDLRKPSCALPCTPPPSANMPTMTVKVPEMSCGHVSERPPAALPLLPSPSPPNNPLFCRAASPLRPSC